MMPEANLVSVSWTLRILGLATWGDCSSCLILSTYHNSFMPSALVYEFLWKSLPPPFSLYFSHFKYKVQSTYHCIMLTHKNNIWDR